MSVTLVRQLIESFSIQEFKGDLQKQFVVLMGIPAAGKSTFIEKELHKYIPGLKTGFVVSGSDAQLKALQYRKALDDFEDFEQVTDQDDLDAFLAKTSYVNNDGVKKVLPLTLGQSFENGASFYRAMQIPFYGGYTVGLDRARADSMDLYRTKIHKGPNYIVLDTVAADATRVIADLADAKQRGYQTTVFFLDVKPSLSIARDADRERKTGRKIGKSAIQGYVDRMKPAYKAYKTNGASPSGSVDRLYRFQWKPTQDDDGIWKLKEKHMFDVRRNVRKTN